MREKPDPKPVGHLRTHPFAVITDFDDRFVLPEIPHNCLAAGVSRRQNVLNLPVPGEGLDVLWGLLRQDGVGVEGNWSPWTKTHLLLHCSQPHRKPNSRLGWGYPNQESPREPEAEFSGKDPGGY